jgi:hypothetical protein
LAISPTAKVALSAILIALCQAIGVPVILRIPILIGLLVYCGLIAVRGTEFASPISLFVISWSAVWTLYCSEIVVYDGIQVGSSPYIYLLVCCALAPLSAALTRAATRSLGPVLASEEAGQIFLRSAVRNKPLISACAVAGITSGLLVAYETFVVRGASPLDIVILRALVEDHRESSIYSQLGAVLAPGGLVSLCGVLLCSRVASRAEKALWVAGALGSSAISVISAGRQTVFQVVIIMFISMALLRCLGLARTVSKRRLWITGIASSLIFAYMVVIGSLRNDALVSKDKYVVDLRMAQAHIEETINDRFEDLPGLVKDGTVESITYASAPIPNFASLWYADIEKPQLGLFGFPFVTRRVRLLFPWVRSDTERMQAYYNAMEAMGKSGEVWYTTVRDFIFDFGYLGALIVMCLYGVLAQKAAHLLANSPTFGSAMVIVSASIVAAYFPLISAISDTSVLLFTCLAVWLAWRERTESLSEKQIEMTQPTLEPVLRLIKG